MALSALFGVSLLYKSFADSRYLLGSCKDEMHTLCFLSSGCRRTSNENMKSGSFIICFSHNPVPSLLPPPPLPLWNSALITPPHVYSAQQDQKRSIFSKSAAGLLPCCHQADIRMRSQRLVLLDGNKSTASCQHARLSRLFVHKLNLCC